MVLAMAYEDAKQNQVKHTGNPSEGTEGEFTQTRFFGSRTMPDSPYAALSQRDGGRYSGPHYHVVDQFQIVVEGSGKLGRHVIAPYCVHFARAYTPYGPLTSDEGSGLSFFVMRRHPDPGSQRLPQKLEQLKQTPNRHPWQITRTVTFLEPENLGADAALERIDGIDDDRGLAAYTVAMRAGATMEAPDPSHSDGQYILVLKGSLLHEHKQYHAWAVVFVDAREKPFSIRAGEEGLQALIMNFPKPTA